jgi:hypothetical protein
MTISATLTAATNAQDTTEVLCHFVEISHDDLVTPLRFVDNFDDVVRDGNTYTGYNFEVQFPDEIPDQVPFCQIKIDNIDRAMVTQIRTLSGLKRMTITVSEALYSSPDTTERGPYEFELYDVDYGAAEIIGRMSYEDFMNDRFPKDRQTAQNQPGLYG